jgi:16S rRNA (uracil1498-N3)-methyltransferase
MKSDTPIFYHSQLSTQPASVVLEEETQKHLVTVLRMQVGDHFVLTDGKGLSAKATIHQIAKKQVTVSLSAYEIHDKPGIKISLGISLLKNTTRFEWMLEKVTELGVHEIFPLITERTERQYFKKERFNQIVRSASLQSEQFVFPLLYEPQSLESLLQVDLPSFRYIAHCYSTEKSPLTKQSNDCILLIGPEGDFTHDEIEAALQKKFIPVGLGVTRLRTETAGIVGVSLLRS